MRTSVDDDVALLKERLELADKVVHLADSRGSATSDDSAPSDSTHGLASLDEEDDLARRLEEAAELLNRVGADNRLSCAALVSTLRSPAAHAPLASLSRKASTLATVLLYAATVNPLSALQTVSLGPRTAPHAHVEDQVLAHDCSPSARLG